MKRVYKQTHKSKERNRAIVKNLLDTGDQKVQHGKRKGRYRIMHVKTCEKCSRKFYQKTAPWLKLLCGDCYFKETGKKLPPQCRYLTKDELEKIKRQMIARGCTVRKMTPEEMKKYNIKKSS